MNHVAIGLCGLVLFGAQQQGWGADQESYVIDASIPGGFCVAQAGAAATIYIDQNDFPGVIRAAGSLHTDILRVTGCNPATTSDPRNLGTNVIIIGTVGKSAVVTQLAQAGKIDVQALQGKWEAFQIQVVPEPLPGVQSGLVITGSDKRGTIYGIYDLCEQLGVSPWYWWADVPVKHRNSAFVKPGIDAQGEPAVKYRGIFLNDEAPSLSNWTHEKFGGYNHQFYEKVFELLLRLKGNYFWPAMWNNAFNEDDPLNPVLADEYGIVVGTSHHEPMLRAHKEWKRHGKGPWDYSANAEILRTFWDIGIQRNKDYESIVSLGMRGDGDMPMSEESNIALLQRIVADQRQILASRGLTNLNRNPQVWALYKEVQEYFEKGMRVPDDVTLLWCDDNFGNIRRLPTADEEKRTGGAGIYYHFDYVGDPRNYKWVNTIPITKVWEQMTLAHNYGANRIWIVNVGDLKPMEFPIDFFLRMAWAPDRMGPQSLRDYARRWAERDFGGHYTTEIAEIVTKYTKYNSRRKPECLAPDIFSLVNYEEADHVVNDFNTLTEKAERIYAALPPQYRDAFFQLVLYPTKASAQVTELYVAAGKNHLFASQGRASANDFAERVKTLFATDTALTDRFHSELTHGKWNHMMDQTHIGYTYWQQPESNSIPALKPVTPSARAEMGIAVEGSASAWPGAKGQPILPGFDSFNRQVRYVDVFNRGQGPFEFSAKTSESWISLTVTNGTVEKDLRLWVRVNWDKAPVGTSKGIVHLVQGTNTIDVTVNAFNPAQPTRESLDGFVESDGCVSIEAEHFTGSSAVPGYCWQRIEDSGRTLSAMILYPLARQAFEPLTNAPCLEYRMYLFHSGKVRVDALVAPTLNFVPGRGLRFAIAFDEQAPQVVDVLADRSQKAWSTSVLENIRKGSSFHALTEPGYHTLKVWAVDPGLSLQKMIVDLGGVRPSYLGPPESYFKFQTSTANAAPLPSL